MADADDLAEIITGTPGSRSRAKTRIRWGINLAWFLGGVGVAGFTIGVGWSEFRRDLSSMQTQLTAISTTLDVKLDPVVTRVAEHEVRIANIEKTLSQCCPAGRLVGSRWPCLIPPGAIARR
jgi:hypothetical protein